MRQFFFSLPFMKRTYQNGAQRLLCVTDICWYKGIQRLRALMRRPRQARPWNDAGADCRISLKVGTGTRGASAQRAPAGANGTCTTILFLHIKSRTEKLLSGCEVLDFFYENAIYSFIYLDQRYD